MTNVLLTRKTMETILDAVENGRNELAMRALRACIGEVSEPCSQCNGQGCDQSDARTTCPSCSGSGKAA